MTFFIISVLALLMALSLRSRARRRPATEGKRRIRIPVVFLAQAMGAAACLFFLLSVVRVVPPGHVAVPVTLGHAGSQVGPGVHLVMPFADLRSISVRTEQYTVTAGGEASGGASDPSVDVLGRDGAAGRVDATLLYRVDRAKSTALYREIGTNYLDKVVRPSARSCIRSAFTHFDMVDAATTSWAKVDDDITSCVTEKLESRGIVVEDFQLRDLELDQKVQKAIDSKVAAQQDSERQRFELTKAEQQADIKRVEAHATADAQQILACGGEVMSVERDGRTINVVVPNPIDRCSQAQLTPQYLQFTYIQALKELVNSPNNSTIILPFDQNLTPLLNIPGNTVTTAPSGSGG